VKAKNDKTNPHRQADMSPASKPCHVSKSREVEKRKERRKKERSWQARTASHDSWC
jgi:hypothetical protein